MGSPLIEPWRKMAGEILGGDPAVAGLMDLRPANPDAVHWVLMAKAALSGDEPMQSLLTQVAMRAAPILAEVRETAEAIVAGRPIPRPKPDKRQGVPLGSAVTQFTREGGPTRGA